jgi:hypothetical protein
MVQVEADVCDKGINLAHVPDLIVVLEMDFGDPDRAVITEGKVEMHKQTNCDVFAYYGEFQCFATDVQ